MKNSRIIIFAIGGGILGFGIHLGWHFSSGISLFSIGPHVIGGAVYTLVGLITGVAFYLIIPKK